MYLKHGKPRLPLTPGTCERLRTAKSKPNRAMRPALVAGPYIMARTGAKRGNLANATLLNMRSGECLFRLLGASDKASGILGNGNRNARCAKSLCVIRSSCNFFVH